MKILYVTAGNHVDYMNDCLLIALKERLGANVVDPHKSRHNYLTFPAEDTRFLYGKGMTVTRILDDIYIDRENIRERIAAKEFDFIVYGSIWRCQDWLEEALLHYPASHIIAVDGEDQTEINSVINKGVTYFKRELIWDTPTLKPISFAMPDSKVSLVKEKVKDFAYITPLNRSTYIYNEEWSYYNDYKEARFGYTCKKAGWDCMRHYEILGNGALPYFPDIEGCPERTMANFPKALCQSVLTAERSGASWVKIYADHVEDFHLWFQLNLTTSQLAGYFIQEISKI